MSDKPRKSLGEQLGGVIGLGATLASTLGIGAAGADKRQRRQQEALNNINAKTAKELADYEQQLKMKMWQDTNYGAILDQAEKAGVSKAAAIGGGVSGTQGASVGSVSGTGAASGVEGQRVKNEQLMMMAQIGNLNADTQKKQAEAEKLQGVDTDLGQTQIQSLTQGIENAKAQEALTNVQKSIGELDAKLKSLSMEDTLDLIEHTARKADSDATIAFNEAYVSGATRNEKIKTIQQELIGTTLRNALTKAQTKSQEKGIEVSEAQIQKMAADIAQGWEALSQGDSKIAIEEFDKEVRANYPSIMNTMGRLLDSTIDGIFSIGGKTRRVYNKVK